MDPGPKVARSGEPMKNPLPEKVVAESLWIYHLELSCCGLEVRAAAGPRFDWERLGCRLVEDHRNADVLLVSGPAPAAMNERIKTIYSEMKSPKYVLAFGSCASTGGMFSPDGLGGVGGLGEIIPVDLFVPGCPPRPESLLHAIIRLQERLRGRS
jgi:NADH-quinone oxidoreductase subunit B